MVTFQMPEHLSRHLGLWAFRYRHTPDMLWVGVSCKYPMAPSKPILKTSFWVNPAYGFSHCPWHPCSSLSGPFQSSRSSHSLWSLMVLPPPGIACLSRVLASQVELTTCVLISGVFHALPAPSRSHPRIPNLSKIAQIIK